MTEKAREVCETFFSEFHDYAQITWDRLEVVLYRPGSTEPFVMGEYRLGTRTREAFEEMVEQFEDEPPFTYKRS